MPVAAARRCAASARRGPCRTSGPGSRTPFAQASPRRAAERRAVGHTPLASQTPWSLYRKTGCAMKFPGLGTLSKNEYGGWVSEPIAIPSLSRTPFGFWLDNYENDPHPEDYHRAVANVFTAGRQALLDAAEFVFRYYRDTRRGGGPRLWIWRTQSVWRHVQLGTTFVVLRDHGEGRDVFLSLECECDWEPEHGLQVVFKNGLSVTKVGPFDDHMSNSSAFGGPLPQKCDLQEFVLMNSWASGNAGQRGAAADAPGGVVAVAEVAGEPGLGDGHRGAQLSARALARPAGSR